MLQNKRTLYDLLFRCVADTLLEVAANPKRLGAEIGFLCVLHTWGQTLMHHPHIHCVVPAGGFAPGRTRWIRPQCAGFFLPKYVLSEVFHGKFTEALKRPFPSGQAEIHGSLAWLAEPRAFARFLHLLHRPGHVPLERLRARRLNAGVFRRRRIAWRVSDRSVSISGSPLWPR